MSAPTPLSHWHQSGPAIRLESLYSERISHSLMVPAMDKPCLLDPDLAQHDLSAWRIGAYGGAPMPVATIVELAEKVPEPVLMNCDGATETTSPATAMPPARSCRPSSRPTAQRGRRTTRCPSPIQCSPHLCRTMPTANCSSARCASRCSVSPLF